MESSKVNVSLKDQEVNISDNDLKLATPFKV